jgi:sugar phosphate isomerase/epimerase
VGAAVSCFAFDTPGGGRCYSLTRLQPVHASPRGPRKHRLLNNIMKTILKLKATLGTTTLAILAALASPEAAAQTKIPDENKVNGWAIGCQAYSFNHFTAFEAIEMTAKAGGKVIEFYPGQKLSKDDGDLKVEHSSPKVDEVVAKLQVKLKQHGVKAVNYGVVDIPKDEAGARKVFDFAKKMGLRAVTTESAGSIDTLEKLAKEYDICVAFHNHPGDMKNPGYKVWSPYYIAGLVEGRDKRLGSAADTGHWTRSGIKPVEALRVLNGRIISSHLKDLNEFGKRDAHDVPYGQGVSGIKECLDELKEQGFDGNISIEYEYNWDNSVPEITECIEFVKNYGK